MCDNALVPFTNWHRQWHSVKLHLRDGRTDGRKPRIIFAASVRPSVRLLDGVWQITFRHFPAVNFGCMKRGDINDESWGTAFEFAQLNLQLLTFMSVSSRNAEAGWMLISSMICRPQTVGRASKSANAAFVSLARPGDSIRNYSVPTSDWTLGTTQRRVIARERHRSAHLPPASTNHRPPRTGERRLPGTAGGGGFNSRPGAGAFHSLRAPERYTSRSHQSSAGKQPKNHHFLCSTNERTINYISPGISWPSRRAT